MLLPPQCPRDTAKTNTYIICIVAYFAPFFQYIVVIPKSDDPASAMMQERERG